MNKEDFKKIWLKSELDSWTEFPFEEIEKSNLNNETIEFLKNGFPESAAPFLGFGLDSYDGKLYNIFDYYDDDELDIKPKNYWVFGSDGAGNPVCFDSSENDKIVLLDHEQGFEIIQTMNKNIFELASSLLLYREFINNVNSELGEDAYFDGKFTEKSLKELEIKFEKLNPHYYVESSFWDSEIENLRAEIE